MAEPEPAPLKTPLNAWHAANGGRLVEFGGWSMPVQYTTIVDEHKTVRGGVGLFDISHMGRLAFDGAGAEKWLEELTTNHVAKLKPGKIQYSLMCSPSGGVHDDVLVYRMADGGLRMVCNASNRKKVAAQFLLHAEGRDATIFDHTESTAMIAVQGPKAQETVAAVTGAALNAIPYYGVAEGTITTGPAKGTPAVISRTGYTGEDGFELIVPAPAAVALWETLLAAGQAFGIKPCGLGARDTLRFEAGMPLYGHEMDESVNPYAAGLGWAVKLDKGPFVGRDALVNCSQGPGMARVGLELAGKRVARQGAQVIRDGVETGVVTSGTFAPTLEKSLAMALVEPPSAEVGGTLVVDVRGKAEPAKVVPLPFYKRPKTS